MGIYDLLRYLIINVHIALNTSIWKGSSVNTSQQTGKEQYILQIHFHNITEENIVLVIARFRDVGNVPVLPDLSLASI